MVSGDCWLSIRWPLILLLPMRTCKSLSLGVGKCRADILLSTYISCKSSITAKSLKGYKKLVKIATDYFEGYLQNINEKLQGILRHAIPASDGDSTELQCLRKERLST